MIALTVVRIRDDKVYSMILPAERERLLLSKHSSNCPLSVKFHPIVIPGSVL
jgi:hypothetical protein